MTEGGVRIDKWLWFARFCKSRAQAQGLIAAGLVMRNDVQLQKAAVEVHKGDVIAVVLGPMRRTVTVLALGDRRGPAAEARALYDEPVPPIRLGEEDLSVSPRPRGHWGPMT